MRRLTIGFAKFWGSLPAHRVSAADDVSPGPLRILGAGVALLAGERRLVAPTPRPP